MKNSLLKSLITLGLILWIACPTFAQQGSSIAQLKQLIAEKESIDLDESTSPEVRMLNRRFLNEHRQELLAALAKEIDNFQKYETQVSHPVDERKVIADLIKTLQTERAELQAKVGQDEIPGDHPIANAPQSSSREPAAVKTSFSTNVLMERVNPQPLAVNSSLSSNMLSAAADCTYPDVPNVIKSDVEKVASDIVERNDVSRIGNIGERSFFFAVTDALTRSESLKLSALEAYTYIGETTRTDKQLGTTSGAGGSTSAAEKPGWSDLIGFAVEHGAIQQQVGNSTLTLSTTPYAFIVPSQDDTAAANRQYGYLKRLGLSASFNITNKNAALANATRKNLAQYSAKLRLSSDHGPNSEEFDDRWIRFIRPAIQTYLNSLSGGIETLFGSNTPLQDYRDALNTSSAADIQTVLNSTNATLVTLTADQKVAAKNVAKAKVAGIILCGLKTKVFDEVKSDGTGKVKIDKATADHIVGSVLPSLIAARKRIGAAKEMFEQMLKDFEKKPVASLSFTNNRPPTGPEYGTFNFLYQRYLSNSQIKMTLNAGPSFYHRPNANMNQQTFRDFISTVSFEGRSDSPFKTTELDLSPMTYSLTGRYQRLQENRGVPKKKADIAVVQFKLDIPIAKGVSIPLALTYANATEQIKEKHVRGNFGFTFDADKFLAVKKLLGLVQQR